MKLYEFFGVPTYEEDKKDDRNNQDHRSEEDKEKLENDLYWFILDDDQLHKEYFIPLAHKLHEKVKSKDFDRSKHIRDWLPMVNQGCMKFYKEQQMTEDPKDIFSKDLRRALCQRLANQSFNDLEKDEYKLG